MGAASLRIKETDAPARHLLLVDDDTRIRELLQKYLVERGYHVTTAADAGQARERLKAFQFDLLVVDVMMPGEDGLSFVRTLRRSDDVPVLLLTARGEPNDRISGFESGADDYLAKPFEPKELLLRIASILRRARPAGDDTPGVALGPLRFDVQRGELTRDGQGIKLTSSEIGLLRLFAKRAGRTVSRQELCGAGRVSERSIDVQVTRLRRKIEPNPKVPRYLQTVWGEGYVLLPD
ncbi:MAG: response regulator [Alphaproteobacteria bacterium]|nr:response regulator [Alphaproteobacteria bacterium]